jgi:hypothetical protein
MITHCKIEEWNLNSSGLVFVHTTQSRAINQTKIELLSDNLAYANFRFTGTLALNIKILKPLARHTEGMKSLRDFKNNPVDSFLT